MQPCTISWHLQVLSVYVLIVCCCVFPDFHVLFLHLDLAFIGLPRRIIAKQSIEQIFPGISAAFKAFSEYIYLNTFKLTLHKTVMVAYGFPLWDKNNQNIYTLGDLVWKKWCRLLYILYHPSYGSPFFREKRIFTLYHVIILKNFNAIEDKYWKCRTLVCSVPDHDGGRRK